MTPDEIIAIRERYHLNDPLYVQYYYYIRTLLRADLGYSKTARDYVSRAILTKLPATFELAGVSLIIAIALGIKAGVISAMRRNKPADHVTRIVALGGASMPVFWLALILLLVFYGQLHVIPIGRYDPAIWPQSDHRTGFYIIDAILNKSWRQLLDAFHHLITPAFVLGYYCVGLITRMTRSCMLEVASKDYITTARAKGLPERVVVLKHIRQNALIPVVTVIGLTFGALLGGSVLTETVFHWPGLGSWAVKAIKDNDVPAVMNYILLVGLIYCLVNLGIDLVYGLLDPRVRY